MLDCYRLWILLYWCCLAAGFCRVVSNDAETCRMREATHSTAGKGEDFPPFKKGHPNQFTNACRFLKYLIPGPYHHLKSSRNRDHAMGGNPPKPPTRLGGGGLRDRNQETGPLPRRGAFGDTAQHMSRLHPKYLEFEALNLGRCML